MKSNGLLKVHTLEAGREKLVHAMEGKGTKSIRLELLNSLDYILAQDILAGEPVPAYRRSMVDGYAVISGDTGGASRGFPYCLSW